MNWEDHIPLPYLFNPLKHHLSFIKEFILTNQTSRNVPPEQSAVRSIKHLGGSVMDVYTGKLTATEIFKETTDLLKRNNIIDKDSFSVWVGKDINDFRVIELHDKSLWTIKYHNNETRYIHLFPARYSPHSFRVKANTLKSAILYIIYIGKDFVSEDDLNIARAVIGLSPVKDVVDSEAITEMIEILRI